jgi:hypothetical protein
MFHSNEKKSFLEGGMFLPHLHELIKPNTGTTKIQIDEYHK